MYMLCYKINSIDHCQFSTANMITATKGAHYVYAGILPPYDAVSSFRG